MTSLAEAKNCHPKRRRASFVTNRRIDLALALLLALIPTSLFAAPKIFFANDYGAKGDGTTLDTAAIQKAIDAAAPKKGTVTFKPGTYLTGSLFLKSGITLDIPEGVTLTGSQDIKDFPDLPTRIAGIEMTWPAAMINVRDQHDVTITGKGTIDQNGAVWWQVYRDTPQNLPAKRPPLGLRLRRQTRPPLPHSELLQHSLRRRHSPSNAPASGPSRSSTLTTSSSTASSSATTKAAAAPPPTASTSTPPTTSTSSHADIDVNDDALCLKAGRDSDGLRVNRPTYNIKVHDSIIRRGAAAITIGSETSGGFRNIEAYNITALADVPNGVLFKSAHVRGGNAKDIRIHDLTFEGVAIPIQHHHELEPQPTATPPCPQAPTPKPSRLTGSSSPRPVPEEKGLPHFSDVHIWNIKATGAKQAFRVSAYPNATLDNFRIDHLNIEAATAGTIANAKNWTLTDNTIKTADGSKVTITESENVSVSDPTQAK